MVMRRQESPQETPRRVQRVIAEYLKDRCVNIDLAYAIWRTISDEQNGGEFDANRLAEMFGYLPVGVLRSLLDQAFDMLEQDVRSTRERAVSVVERRVREVADPADPRSAWERPVSELREESGSYYIHLSSLATICDALITAISKPKEVQVFVRY
jgi:hypothetical protein